MRDFIEQLFRWLNIFLILATLAAYLSPHVNPQTTWVFALFGLAYPFLLAANIFFVLFWSFFRKKYFLFSFCCILLGWSHVQGILGFHAAQKSDAETLHVMSYNCYNFRKIYEKKGDAKLRAATSKLAQSADGLDIVCFQELTSPKYVKAMKKLLNMSHHVKHSSSGVNIYSKYPIQQSGKISFGNRTGNSCLWADIKVNKKTIRVYSLHLQSTKISSDADELIKSGDLQTRETWRGIRGILSKYRHSANTRTNQAEKVLKHVRESPYPVILCGDFNDTPLSYVYAQFEEVLSDNFQEAGKGWGTTYAGSLPGLKIDYIFTKPKDFKVLKHQVVRRAYSDHYPVFSHLVLE